LRASSKGQALAASACSVVTFTDVFILDASGLKGREN
jgi:hypothetical protein